MKLTTEQRKKLELLRLMTAKREKLRFSYDPKILESRPTKTQLEILKSTKNIHYVIGSTRSGKSSLGARVMSWWFENNHPYLKRPKKWGDGPITLLLVGRVGENMESELWANKLELFLEPGSYKIIKSGNAITRVEHKTNKNRIIFISHNDPEAAREKAQGYTAQVVWLDEMPGKVGILNELRNRVIDSNGFMYCTFTPLLNNHEIPKIVDKPTKRSKKWFISLLDNPKFSKSERADLIEEYRAMSASEAEFNARLYGQWMTGSSRVFLYDPETHFKKPEEYEPSIWPHVAIVDPAASGTAGLTVWAREPKRDIWYCIMAKYIKGTAFSQMVPDIEKIIEPFNVIKRLCDCNPSGFYHEAAVQKIKYQPITDKSYNKENMIDACNNALMSNQVYLSPGSELLVDELTLCSRSEDNPDRIIKASKYHTADTFRYFIHLKPKMVIPEPEPRLEERVRHDWKKYLTRQNERVIKNQVRTRFHTINRRRYL